MKRAALLIAMVALGALPALGSGEGNVYGTVLTYDQADGAPGLGVRVGWNLNAAITFDFAVNLMDNTDLDASTGYVGSIRATPLDFGAKYRFPIGMYVGGGVSYVLFHAGDLDVDEEVGFYGRVGYQRAISGGWSWFVEGLYRDYEADVGVIVDLSGPGVAGGALVRW